MLETAAGTGVLTRAIAARLPEADIVATDLNQPMLDRAAMTICSAGVWRGGRRMHSALPFDDRSFDAVVCQFGVMFFPDKVAGFREARRVLRDGKPFLYCVGSHRRE